MKGGHNQMEETNEEYQGYEEDNDFLGLSDAMEGIRKGMADALRI